MATQNSKRLLAVHISAELYEKLLQYAVSKYKKAHGSIARAVEDILKWYFEMGEKNA